jgi:hypothetical protein
MFGLTVRWSLADADAGVAGKLREYVTGQSLARFSGMAGLRFKTWRMRAGEWFEGTYVFETASARDDFLAGFVETAATSPGSQIIGSSPVLMEPFEVVAVAEGGAGFAHGPGPGAS